MCDAPLGRDLVGRIGPDRGVEHDRQVGDAAGQRTGDVLGGRQRHHAGAARQALGAAQPDQVLIGGWDADRPARVAAHAGGGEAGTDGGAGAAAQSTRHALQVVGIAGLVGERRDRCDAGREFVHRGLAEDHGAGVAQPLDLEGVGGRLQRRQAEGAARGRHADRVVVVLDQHRDAVERPARAFLRPFAVERVGLVQRPGVEEHDRIQPRAGLVIGPDPGQVRFDQPARGDAPRGLRRLQVDN